MKIKSFAKRDRDHFLSRRNLIKWSLATGAALGVPVWKVFEILENNAGYAVAGPASCLETNRSIHLVAGGGGLGWFAQLFPHPDLARANSGSFTFHRPGEQIEVPGADHDLVLSPDSPRLSLAPEKQITCIMGGDIEIHTDTPAYTSTLGSNTSLFAACSAMQLTNPTLVPVITVGGQSLGAAPGAPRAASVPSSESILALFDSAASRLGGTLEEDADALLFESYYNSLLELNAAVGKPGTARGLATGQDAARLLGTNLANELAATPDDLLRYQIGPATRELQAELGKGLIIAAKAFRLGLTSMVVLPALIEDPHGAFDQGGFMQTEVGQLGHMIDMFFEDLKIDDPWCPGTMIEDNTVMSIHGDTPRTPFQRSNWPDPTPGNTNIAFVYGAGYLKSGWFGTVERSGDNSIQLWDPETGDPVPFSASMRRANAKHAAAAVAFAVARGDDRRVSDFTDDSVQGITNLPF